MKGLVLGACVTALPSRFLIGSFQEDAGKWVGDRAFGELRCKRIKFDRKPDIYLNAPKGVLALRHELALWGSVENPVGVVPFCKVT